MMTTKKQTFMLSYASFASFVLIGALSAYLLLTNSSFNLISNTLTCTKLISFVVSILAVLTQFLNYIVSRSQDSFQQRIQIKWIFKTVLFLVVFCFLFHFIIVLFGAPFFQKTAETFHLAMLMTSLVALPCCLVAGPSLEDWLDLFTQHRDADIGTVVFLSSLGALTGGWLGAVPIPLDWDRPWQEWPTSCCVGAVTGYCLSLFLASLYLPHRYSQLNKSKRI